MLGRSGLAAASFSPDIHPLGRPLRRMSARTRLCHHPGKVINNYLIILIIFVKQRTYLARPPPAEPPNLKRTQKYQILQILEQAAPGRDTAT
jgi:hypothetical protein